MTKYLDFLNKENNKVRVEGSSLNEINKVENELGFKLPSVLVEYLLITGLSANLYSIWDYHGTKDIKYLHEWIYEWIEKYRGEGIELKEIENILPFLKWQDTFFYVPIEEGNENPPVYAFDINDTPTIRKLNESFTDFVLERYNKIVKNSSCT